MRGLLRENLLEAFVGLLVVLLAIWFIFFAWGRTGGSMDDAIQVRALFPAANGISVGTDVRVAGLKVGEVAAQRLDPETFQAELVLALEEGVRVPSDSAAAINADGLLGGSHISLLPGGSPTPLKDGDTILETQGSVDMMSMIGSVINRSGNDGGEPPSNGLGTMEEPAAR